MNIINIFKKNKGSEERAQEVNETVHEAKNKFTSDMLKLQEQSRKIHEANIISLEESKKLNKIVTDIANQVAIATGGKKRGIK